MSSLAGESIFSRSDSLSSVSSFGSEHDLEPAKTESNPQQDITRPAGYGRPSGRFPTNKIVLTVPHEDEQEAAKLGAEPMLRAPLGGRSAESVASGYVVSKFDTAAQQRLSRWLPENYRPLITGPNDSSEALVRAGAVRNGLMDSWMMPRDHPAPERFKSWLPENHERLVVPAAELDQVRARAGAVYNDALKGFYLPKDDVRTRQHFAQWLPTNQRVLEVPAGQEGAALRAGAVLDPVSRTWMFKEHEIDLHPQVKAWVKEAEPAQKQADRPSLDARDRTRTQGR